MTLTGKAALVSGAAGGIGRAISIAFAEAGAVVACCDINMVGVAETARLVEKVGGQALSLHCEVATEGETRQAAGTAYDTRFRIQRCRQAASADPWLGAYREYGWDDPQVHRRTGPRARYG